MLKRTDFAEKRQFGRRQTSIRAWAKVGGRPSLPCVVRNLSEGGALLEFDEPVWLPFGFLLLSEYKTIDRVCEIRHQTANRIGVQFVEHAEAYEPPKNAVTHDTDSWMGGHRPGFKR